jgi:uncharacterized protein YeaO (DUF488 family)
MEAQGTLAMLVAGNDEPGSYLDFQTGLRLVPPRHVVGLPRAWPSTKANESRRRRETPARRARRSEVIRLKRAYESPSPTDGHRVLVDRLWPRGLRKEGLGVEEWLSDVAPSEGLRKWFMHDPRKFAEFSDRYADELRAPERAALVEALARRAARQTVTLVYAARDEEHNNAVVLARELLRRMPSRSFVSGRVRKRRAASADRGRGGRRSGAASKTSTARSAPKG